MPRVIAPSGEAPHERRHRLSRPRHRAGAGARRGRPRAEGRAGSSISSAASSSKATSRSATTASSARSANTAASARSTSAARSSSPASSTRIATSKSSLITPLEFDRCVLAPWRDDVDLRPARDRQRARRSRACATSSTRAMATAMDLRVQLSSCVPATALETAGRAARGRRSPAARRPPEGARASPNS